MSKAINLTKEQRLIILHWINRTMNNDLLRSRIDQMSYGVALPKMNTILGLSASLKGMNSCDALWCYWVITGNGDHQIQRIMDVQCPDYQPHEPNELLGAFFEILESIGVSLNRKG